MSDMREAQRELRDQTILLFHEESMSENIEQAAIGRLSKTLMPAMADVIVDELARETDPTTLMIAVIETACRMVGTFTNFVEMNSSAEKAPAEVREEIAAGVHECLRGKLDLPPIDEAAE